MQWRSTTYQETWRWVTEVAMGLKHLGIRDGDAVAIMSRTRPAWLTADIGAMSLGAVTCPIYPSSEAGQAAFVINNVKAKLIFVENLQQYHKIEKVRADCPTLEHVDRHRRARASLPPMAVSFDDIFDLSEAEPGELREWEEHWRTFRRDKVATIVHTSGTTGEPEGRGADPRQHPAQLRGRHPGRGLQRARPVSLVPAAVAHDRARGGSGRAAGSRLHDRLCRADDLAAGGQHGRDRADRHGRRAAPVRDACTPACSRPSRPGRP